MLGALFAVACLWAAVLSEGATANTKHTIGMENETAQDAELPHLEAMIKSDAAGYAAAEQWEPEMSSSSEKNAPASLESEAEVVLQALIERAWTLIETVRDKAKSVCPKEKRTEHAIMHQLGGLQAAAGSTALCDASPLEAVHVAQLSPRASEETPFWLPTVVPMGAQMHALHLTRVDLLPPKGKYPRSTLPASAKAFWLPTAVPIGAQVHAPLPPAAYPKLPEVPKTVDATVEEEEPLNMNNGEESPMTHAQNVPMAGPLSIEMQSIDDESPSHASESDENSPLSGPLSSEIPRHFVEAVQGELGRAIQSGWEDIANLPSSLP